MPIGIVRGAEWDDSESIPAGGLPRITSQDEHFSFYTTSKQPLNPND